MTIDTQLQTTVEELRRQLAEAKQTIQAFARGEIDAVVDLASATPLLLQHAQEELRRREQLLRAIFDGVDEGILLVDSAGVYLDANPAACAVFGVQKSELVGRRTEDFAASGMTRSAKDKKSSLTGSAAVS